jgi:hypothetical protein
LGSEGLFSPFWPPKVFFFLLHIKCPIDGYITWSYWFWAANSVFGLWGLFKIFDPQKYIFTCPLENSQSMHKLCNHIDFGAQILFLGSEGLFYPFWPPKVYFFLLHIKCPIDGYITWSYWFWAPNSVFGLWGLFIIFDPQKYIFPAPYKMLDRWIYGTAIFILEPKFRFWAMRAYFHRLNHQ